MAQPIRRMISLPEVHQLQRIESQMNVESYRQEVRRCQDEIARLQREKGVHASKAADASMSANKASDAASRAGRVSGAQTKLREAQRCGESFARHQQKVADLESKIAQQQKRLIEAHKKVAEVEKQERRRRYLDQQTAARQSARQMAAIAGKLSRHDQLHQVALSAIDKLQNLPRQVTVLFLAANPLDQPSLRLDEEVREIGEMIRKADFRDGVRLESRWAVRPLDVLQAINECRPSVIHFSGHGSMDDEIVFQDGAGCAKFVSKEAIVQTIAAASDEVQLVFFNTCFSSAQAEAVVEHVAAAIGMNATIDDPAARTFAACFYSAIGFGLSIGQAFRQAKAALMLEGMDENDASELFVANGLQANELILVKPMDR